MKNKCKFERKGGAIKDLSTNKITAFASRNLAKKESVKLQAGALGQGTVKVVSKFSA